MTQLYYGLLELPMDSQLDSNTTLQEGADTLPSYCTGMTGSPTQQQHCVHATGSPTQQQHCVQATGSPTQQQHCVQATGSPTQQQHCVQATGQRVELSVQSNGGSLLGIKSNGMLTLRNPQDPTSDKLDSECKYHCKLVSWCWELPFQQELALAGAASDAYRI